LEIAGLKALLGKNQSLFWSSAMEIEALNCFEREVSLKKKGKTESN